MFRVFSIDVKLVNISIETVFSSKTNVGIYKVGNQILIILWYI